MLFIRGAKQLLTLRGRRIRRGRELSDLGVIPDGAVLIDGETIDEVGSTRRLENLSKARGAQPIDATGKVVMPSFADPRTRIVFSTPALRNFEELILKRDPEDGGPPDGPPGRIEERRISPKALRLKARRWLRRAAEYGSTAVEARVGRGSDAAAELRFLRAVRALDSDPIEVRAAYAAGMGAGGRGGAPSDAERVAEALRRAAAGKLIHAVSIDWGVDGLDEDLARDVAAQARSLGLALKIEARSRRDGPEAIRFAVEHGALSIDRLEQVSDAGIMALAQSTAVATLVPGLVYHRGDAEYPPARRLVDGGAAVALASGFGPDSSPTLSMPMTMSLACRQMGLLPEESIAAATINAAAALGRAELLGSLEPGKQADLAVFDVGDYREIPFYYGMNLCALTIRRGRVIHPLAPVTRKAPDGGGLRPFRRRAV